MKVASKLIFTSLLLCFIFQGADAATCQPSTQRVQCGDHACISGICAPCTVDADCYQGGMQCDVAGGGLCKLKSLHGNLTPGALSAMILSMLVCCVGIVAGVGGGGILVPLFTVLLQLPVSFAVVVSQLTIVGQSSFSFLFIAGRRHEDDESRPLVNFQYLSLLMPMAIAGTSVGVQVGKLLPDVGRVALLMFTFVALLRRLVAKAIDQFNASRGSRQVPTTAAEASRKTTIATTGCGGEMPPDESASDSTALRDMTAVPSDDHTGVIGVLPTTAGRSGVANSSEVGIPALSTSSTVGGASDSLAAEYAVVSSSVIILLIASVTRQLTACGSLPYGLLSLTPLCVLLGVFGYAYRRLEARHERSLGSGGEMGGKPLHFVWNRHTVLLFPLIAIGAGAAAAMLGIGGGLILGFLLFEAGLTPQESSATSAVATLLVAGESVIQLSMSGLVQLDYAVVFLGIGAFSGFLGQKVIMVTIRQRGWNFLIIGSLTLIVALSMVCLVSLGVYQTATSVKEGGGSLLSWGTLCPKKYVESEALH